MPDKPVEPSSIRRQQLAGTFRDVKHAGRIHHTVGEDPGPREHIEVHLDPKKLIKPGMELETVGRLLDSARVEGMAALESHLPPELAGADMKAGAKYVAVDGKTFRFVTDKGEQAGYRLWRDSLTGDKVPQEVIPEDKIPEALRRATDVIIPYTIRLPDKADLPHKPIADMIRGAKEELTVQLAV